LCFDWTCSWNICVLIFSTNVVWNITHSEKNWARYDKMYIGLHVKFPFFLSYSTGTWIFWTDFQKLSNVKFNEGPFSRSRAVPCGVTDRPTDRHVTNLIVAFRNFANAPKIAPDRIQTPQLWRCETTTLSTTPVTTTSERYWHKDLRHFGGSYSGFDNRVYKIY